MYTNRINRARHAILENHPLIHSMTSSVAFNDAANVVLALGAQPIHAEYPREMADIVSVAKALTVTVANISDVRMESMKIAGRKARELGVPSLIDSVGVTCSSIRMAYIRDFIAEVKPNIIKGNYSEIRALSGMSFDQSTGLDVSEKDQVSAGSSMDQMKKTLMAYSSATGSVILATGAVDLVADAEHCVEIHNGHPLMSRITGTGCVLSCIVGAFASVCDPFDAAVAGTVCWGIAGELAAESLADGAGRIGLGSYHEGLLDQLTLLEVETVERMTKVIE